MTDAPSDDELLRRLARGDIGAFDELYARSADVVYRVALRVTGSEADAADVTQMAFEHVFERARKLRLSGRLTTFLYPVTVRLARRARERARRHVSDGEAFQAAIEGLAAGAEAAGGDPSADRAALAARLGRLPVGQREALLLRVVDGLSVQQTAEALGIPEGTVRSRVHGALRALRASGDFDPG